MSGQDFPDLVALELTRARTIHGPIHSGPEAYAVIAEEVDEFWLEVRGHQPPAVKRERMLNELLQVGAMAQRAAEDLGLLRVDDSQWTREP